MIPEEMSARLEREMENLVSTELKEVTAALLEEVGGGDGLFQTRIPGLIVMRSSEPTRPECMLYRPALCLIVQGAKEMAVGKARAAYREGQSLIVTADVPTLGYIAEASPQYPFIGLGLELEPSGMREVIEQLARTPQPQANRRFELFVGQTSKPIEDCLIRLIRAAERPFAISVLHPSIMREIYYWLLMGPNGDKIAGQFGVSGPTQRIARVVHFLREAFTRPIRIDQLAELANMSTSSFHHHFRSLTSMTPLQFQKQLRLIEARRLLVTNGVSVAEAAFRVGYESASQFSREYRRKFGLPPARDNSYRQCEIKAYK